MAVTEAAPIATTPPAPETGGRSHDRLRHWALGIWSVLALLYLFIPVFIVVLFSFNDNQAASTSPGRASRCATGCIRSRTRTSRRH